LTSSTITLMKLPAESQMRGSGDAAERSRRVAMVLSLPALMLASFALASPAAAAATPWTLRQVKSHYPGMNMVHIEKCDRNGDGLFDRGDRGCLSGIYNALYRERR